MDIRIMEYYLAVVREGTISAAASAVHVSQPALSRQMRELEEELGIRADESELSFAGNFVSHYERVFYDKPFRDNEYTFVYVYDKPVEIEALKLQADEVESVKWFDIDQVSKAIEPPRDERFCVPIDGFAVLRAWVEMKPVKQEQI
jgi:isopentenyldiphosphate isomerase